MKEPHLVREGEYGSRDPGELWVFGWRTHDWQEYSLGRKRRSTESCPVDTPPGAKLVAQLGGSSLLEC